MTTAEPRRPDRPVRATGPRRRRRVAPVLGLAALVVAGGLGSCGGDDGNGDAGMGAGANGDPAAVGEELFMSETCASCHSITGGDSTGPHLDGIYGTEVELEGGETVEVDDEYLRESITDPGAQVVAGHASVMPTLDLSDAEVDALVAYIRSLG